MPGFDSPSRGMNMLLRGRIARKPEARAVEPTPESVTPDPAPPSQPALLPLCVRIPMAAQMLGIGRTKLYQLIKRGELETIKLDDSVLIPVRSLEAFVARHATCRRSE